MPPITVFTGPFMGPRTRAVVTKAPPSTSQNSAAPPQQLIIVEGLDPFLAVGIAFATFVLGIVLVAAIWCIHTRTGEHHHALLSSSSSSSSPPPPLHDCFIACVGAWWQLLVWDGNGKRGDWGKGEVSLLFNNILHNKVTAVFAYDINQALNHTKTGWGWLDEKQPGPDFIREDLYTLVQLPVRKYPKFYSKTCTSINFVLKVGYLCITSRTGVFSSAFLTSCPTYHSDTINI